MWATKITDEYLLNIFKAIEARSVDQEKASHVNSLTLCFRDSDKERQYQDDPDIGNIYTLFFLRQFLLILFPP